MASTAAHESESGLDPTPTSEYVELFRGMTLIRRFEDAVQTLFQRGEISGTTHL